MHHIDILKDWSLYQQSIVDWMKERRWALKRNGERAEHTRERTGLACNVIRAHRMVWGGIGVYTIVNYFHMAGTFVITLLLSSSKR